MSKHHELSPSSAPALLQCASYKSAPDSSGPFNEDAKIGSQMHLFCEKYLLSGIVPDTKLSVDHIEKCVHAVDDFKNYLLAHLVAENLQIQTEKKLQIFDNNNNVISEGTCDVFATDGHVFIGCDWKGCLDFDWDKSYKPQMCFYALGIMQEHNIKSIKWVEYHILPGKLVEYDLARDECESIVSAVYKQKYFTKNERRVNYYCRYCSDLLKCSAINSQIDELGMYHIGKNTFDKVKTVDAIIDGFEMSKMLFYAKTIEQYQKKLSGIVGNIKSSAQKLIEGGVPIYKHKLGIKARNTIKRVSEAYRRVHDQVDLETFEKSTSLSVDALADEMNKNLVACGSKTNKAGIKRNLQAKFIDLMEISTSYFIEQE